MAITAFSAKERYKRGGTEPREKLKKVRSVKVANLDKLRSSMKRDKYRIYRGVEPSADEAATDSSSAAISGTSSPNYMKATTSSSARKGSLEVSSGSSSVKSGSKSNKVSVQDCSDLAGVDIPVKVKPEKTLKRVPSLKHSKRLSSKKSMRIRARYSQFSDVGFDQGEMLGFQDNAEITGGGTEIDTESLNASGSKYSYFTIEEGAKPKGILKRLRSRKLTRLRSIRSSRIRQRPKSRLSGGGTEVVPFEAEVSEPHYMKATTSQQARKNPEKGLARTSSLRPLRILAKIPSLRPRRSKVKKRPQNTPLSGTGVLRPTCSSTLKRAQFPDDIELHSRDRELEGPSSLNVCPYSYCSIHGHSHHTPPQPLKEFVSAKRKLFTNQKGEQLENQSRGGAKNVTNASEAETDQSEQKFSAESYASHEVMSFTAENAPEDEDDGMDFLIKIYDKPRKKWDTEGTLSQDAEALNIAIYDQINGGESDEKLPETLSEPSGVEEKQGALNDDQQTQQQNSKFSALSLPCYFPEIGPISVSVNETLEPSIAEEHWNSFKNSYNSASTDSEAIRGDYLTHIISDREKYTSMWQLIYQELVSNEESMSQALGDIQAEEQKSDSAKTCHEKSNNEDLDDDIAARKKIELEQSAAIKLVQGALNAILQHDTKLVQEMTNSLVAGENLREGGQKDEKGINLESAENQNNKQIGNALQKNEEPKEQETAGQKMSKILSKLKKMFVTAKFIKAMERLKRINPHKPQYLSAEPVLENEKVYLRHLSIKGTMNTEEWMLDYALRQAISRLDPDQQKRVAQLVEAFERVTPEKKEKSNRPFPVISMLDSGSELAIPVNGERKKFVEPNHDLSFSRDQVVGREVDGGLAFHSDEKKKLTVVSRYQGNKTDDKFMQESADTPMSESTLVLSEKSFKSASVNKASDDEATVDEKPINTPKVSSKNPTQGSEVSPAGDVTSIFNKKQNYTSMWNLIYQHVSSEVPVGENQGNNDLDEEEQGGEANSQNIDVRCSTSSKYSMDQKEDDYDKNVTSIEPDLDQSAATKLVKEALHAILKQYEQPTHTESIHDHDRAVEEARDLCLSDPASHTEGNSTYLENTSQSLQQEMESDKFKEPQRKMSKSLSKLKKAIATTRFIKAMERLIKSTPRKSQILSSDPTSEGEKVHLRHRSMNDRKKGEEWMLDHALRQVVSKLDPDQQRRVALLVEAFETMHPEQKDTRIRCPLKGEATDCKELATAKSHVKENNHESQQQQSTSIETVHHKQDDGILLPARDAFLERSLQEHNQLASSAENILEKEINKSEISGSTLESSEQESKIISPAVVKLKEPSVGDEEAERAIEFSSSFPTGYTEVKPEDEMTSILFDKQKYTSMWHLIYQHVLSNEASTAGKQEVNDVAKEEQGYDADTCPEVNNPSSIQGTQKKKSKVDEDNQSAASDQSAAIYLVKEAIHAILQCHEQKSDQRSLQDHGRTVNDSRKLWGTTALAFTKGNGGKRVKDHRDAEIEDKFHIVENTSASLHPQAEPKEGERKMSKSLSKLKQAIVTAKFIKAMERLKKISPRKPHHLSAEATSEEERVYLRHLSINARKYDEEWMLDYALKKVISDLAPDQQRKVARLVEAFETVNQEQKGIRYATKSKWKLDVGYESEMNKGVLEFKQDSSTACDGNIPSMHNDRVNMLQTRDTLQKSVLEDQSINLSNLKMELPHKTLDSEDSNLNIHHKARLKGTTVGENILTKRKEIDNAYRMHEPIEPAKDSQKDCNPDITKGLLCDQQKSSSMWLLISQHVKSVSDAESGNKMNEKLTNEDQLNKYNASPQMIDEDSDESRVTTELTEDDAIKLVREAINDILDAPQGLVNELTSSNRTAEEPKKSLSRGYSKLRKLIICNKFIKAMEKTRKLYPGKQLSLTLNSYSGMEKAQLKPSAAGERKWMDEWMLDNVLQKAIAGLAPIKQKRVALLVEAFEKVNPNPEERGKVPCCTKTEFPDSISLEGNTKGRDYTETLQNSRHPCSFDLKLEGSTTSDSEVATLRVPQEIHKKRCPVLTKEIVSDGGNQRMDGLCNATQAATSSAIDTLSYTSKEPTVDGANGSGVPLEERVTFKDRTGSQHREKTSTFANKSLQLEDLEGESNHSAQDRGSMGKPTSLWGLILQRVTTDMLEKGESPKPCTDVDAQEDCDRMSEREIDNSSQSSSKVKSYRDMGVQTPVSFDFKEDEAIKLVEEAVEEMLLVQDQLSDTDTSSTISEQEVHSQKNGDSEEPSSTETQITAGAALLHLTTPDEEKLSTKENLSKSYSTLSKVMMCKRFVKAMNKRRKLKAAFTQEVAQPPHSEEGIPSLRQITTSDKKSWEEGMLDQALQKVIGNLAPAKKQRVALLVQAFEAVGSQPEPTSNWRGKVSAS